MTRLPRAARSARSARCAVLAGCAGLVMTACATTTLQSAPPTTPQASSSPVSPSAPPSASASPSVSPSAAVLPPQAAALNPLTGLPLDGTPPVLVVKLDNTRNAQPHAGLHRADIVYVEEVEYGITRLAAVFSGRVPTRIGPVRSARITDVDLLAQYDRPAFAFSGAQRKMLPVLAAAPFFDESPTTGIAGYSRDSSRPAPYNLFVDGRAALARAPRASAARDIGFAFDVDVPAGGLVAKRAEMSWISSSASFRYDFDTGLYQVSLNGDRAEAEEHGRGQNAATVVIQYVKQTPSAYSDRYGGNTPHAQTIGTGKAIVLRDGLAWRATWTRPAAQDGTQFTLEDGSVVPFKPGQTWVVLLDRERAAKVRPMTEPPSLTGAAPGLQ